MHELARMAHQTDDYETMERWLEASLAIQRTLGDLHGEAETLALLGFCKVIQTQYAKAEILLQASVAAFQKTDDIASMNRVKGNLGIALWIQGGYEAAYELVSRSLNNAQKRGDLTDVATKSECLVSVQIHLGQYDEADKYARQGLALVKHQNNYWTEAGINRCLGKLALIRQDHEAAHYHFRQALQLSASIGPRDLHVRARILLAFAERGLGNQAQASKHLLTGFKETSNRDVRVALIYAFVLMALLLLDQGQFERAVELYAKAASHPIVANSYWFDQIARESIRNAAALAPLW